MDIRSHKKLVAQDIYPDTANDVVRGVRFNDSCLSKSFTNSPTDSNEFTFSGWFKFDYSNQVDADYTVIFNAHEDQPYTAEIGSVGFRNTGSINFAQFDYTSGAPKGTINLNYSTNAAPFYRDPSAWYHFVWSYDYSGYVKIYVNGDLIGNHSFTRMGANGGHLFYIGGGGQVSSLDANDELYGYDDHSKTLYWASSTGSKHIGAISSVLMYQRALTELEVKQNFNALRGRYSL